MTRVSGGSPFLIVRLKFRVALGRVPLAAVIVIGKTFWSPGRLRWRCRRVWRCQRHWPNATLNFNLTIKKGLPPDTLVMLSPWPSATTIPNTSYGKELTIMADVNNVLLLGADPAGMKIMDVVETELPQKRRMS